jgi:hypothetical protein
MNPQAGRCGVLAATGCAHDPHRHRRRGGAHPCPLHTAVRTRHGRLIASALPARPSGGSPWFQGAPQRLGHTARRCGTPQIPWRGSPADDPCRAPMRSGRGCGSVDDAAQRPPESGSVAEPAPRSRKRVASGPRRGFRTPSPDRRGQRCSDRGYSDSPSPAEWPSRAPVGRSRGSDCRASARLQRSVVCAGTAGEAFTART